MLIYWCSTWSPSKRIFCPSYTCYKLDKSKILLQSDQKALRSVYLCQGILHDENISDSAEHAEVLLEFLRRSLPAEASDKEFRSGRVLIRRGAPWRVPSSCNQSLVHKTVTQHFQTIILCSQPRGITNRSM